MGTQGTALPPVKNVTVYRNGDPFFPGRRFVVNHRQVATLETFLNDVTRTIQAPVAVRVLYTPGQGHKVHELHDLRPGAQYVAAGFERFKKMDYSNTGLRPAVNRGERAQGRAAQRPNVSAKWRKAIHLPCIIHVFRNGDLLCPPLRFIIPRSALQDLEPVLSMVSEKAGLRTGAVRRLCTLEGGAVSTGEELESGQYYVAVGTEKFKKLPYVELLVPKAPVGHGHRNHYGDRRLPKRYENRKPVSVPQDRYSDSTLLNSPEADGRRVKSTGDETGGPVPMRGVHKKQGRAPRPEDSLFFAKPAKVHKNRAPGRYTQLLRAKAHPSVFKGDVRKRRAEVRGAEEVPEDEDTAVEFPVDERLAETVEYEELDNQLRPATPRDNPALLPARRLAETVEYEELDNQLRPATPRDNPALLPARRLAETVEYEELDNQLRPATPRDNPALLPAREQNSTEHRIEDGHETNRSTPSRYRETNSRTGSALNEDKPQEENSTEHRIEDGHETNRSTPSRYRETNSRNSSALNEDKLQLQEENSTEHRIEDGHETNRSTPSRYRETNSRSGSALNEDKPQLQEENSTEHRIEDGHETNRSTPSRYRETNSRTGSALNEDKPQETAGQGLRVGSVASRGSQDVEETQEEESSQVQQEMKRPKSGAGSATFRSYQDPQGAGKIRPASRLSFNQLAA